MHKNTSKKGFTLVEIMIVVVIIGLLASMAIPAFNQVRRSSRGSKMDNDARQLAFAAQNYMMEESATRATVSYTAGTGVIGGDLTPWLRIIGQDYTAPANIDAGGTFVMQHASALGGATGTALGGQVTYNAEGQRSSP